MKRLMLLVGLCTTPMMSGALAQSSPSAPTSGIPAPSAPVPNTQGPGQTTAAQGVPGGPTAYKGTNLDSRNESLLAGIFGTKPIYDNTIDIRTQKSFQYGLNNVANNNIIRNDVDGTPAPTFGSNVAAATQLNAQIGNHNHALNQAGLNLYTTGTVPAALAGLVRNDVFVGTQFSLQYGHDNIADNLIDTTSQIGN